MLGHAKEETGQFLPAIESTDAQASSDMFGQDKTSSDLRGNRRRKAPASSNQFVPEHELYTAEDLFKAGLCIRA
jgi:hypothetical protein